MIIKNISTVFDKILKTSDFMSVKDWIFEYGKGDASLIAAIIYLIATCRSEGDSLPLFKRSSVGNKYLFEEREKEIGEKKRRETQREKIENRKEKIRRERSN